MRLAALTFAAGLLLAPLARARTEDVPLAPFGLPFEPVTLRAVPSTHPLHRKLELAPLEGAPDHIDWFLQRVVSAKELDGAVRTTLDKAEMLASSGEKPEYRLTVRWLGLDAPMRVSFHSTATATLRWTVTHIPDGEEVFSSEVATPYETGGGDAARRRRAVARFALLTNIASGVTCIDRAATAPPPSDCALTPKARLIMPRVPPPPMIIYTRR